MEKTQNEPDLSKTPNRHKISILCSQCNNYNQITAIKAKKNIQRNTIYICINCKQPPTNIKRNERTKIAINCSICKNSLEISKESIRRNIKKYSSYTCQKCACKISDKSKLSSLGSIRGKEKWSQEQKDHLKEIMNTNTIKSKISKNSIKNWANKEYAEKVTKAVAENRSPSKIQIVLYELLESLNIKFEKEGKQTCFGYWAFDCLVPKQKNMQKNLLIECQGDYWHELSKKQTKDRQKFTFIDRYFPEHEIMYIWEHEFTAEKRVIDRLKLKLGVEIQTVNFEFKDLKIKKCEKSEIQSFFDAYHYIGGRRSGIAVGCYHHDKLIAATIFSNPVRQNLEFGQPFRELSRFCIHPSYHKKNFASWFISRSCKYSDKKLIVAYADTTVGHNGAIYKASGFKFLHETRPDYWYIDNENKVVTKKTAYDRAKKYKMTEQEYTEKYKLLKKWGGKKLCFIKRT